MSRKHLYPGVKEAELQKSKKPVSECEPDFVGGCVPNYDKFKGWTAEEVLVYLNID